MTASACPRCRGTISNIQVAKNLDKCYCPKCSHRYCYKKDAEKQCLDIHICDGGDGPPHGRMTIEQIMAAADKDKQRNANREARRKAKKQGLSMSAGVDSGAESMHGVASFPGASSGLSPNSALPTALERDAQATLASLAMRVINMRQPSVGANGTPAAQGAGPAEGPSGGPMGGTLAGHVPGEQDAAAVYHATQSAPVHTSAEALQGPFVMESPAETSTAALGISIAGGALTQHQLAALQEQNKMLMQEVESVHSREAQLLKVFGDTLAELQEQHQFRVERYKQTMLAATGSAAQAANEAINSTATHPAVPQPMSHAEPGGAPSRAPEGPSGPRATSAELVAATLGDGEDHGNAEQLQQAAAEGLAMQFMQDAAQQHLQLADSGLEHVQFQHVSQGQLHPQLFFSTTLGAAAGFAESTAGFYAAHLQQPIVVDMSAVQLGGAGAPAGALVGSRGGSVDMQSAQEFMAQYLATAREGAGVHVASETEGAEPAGKRQRDNAVEEQSAQEFMAQYLATTREGVHVASEADGAEPAGKRQRVDAVEEQ